MKLDALFFEGLQFQNIFSTFFFSMKHLQLETPKIYPCVNNYLWFLHVLQGLGDPLHVRCYSWYLIMASTKLI